MNRLICIVLLVCFKTNSLSSNVNNKLSGYELLNQAEKYFLNSALDLSLKYLGLAESQFQNKGQDSLIAVVANQRARIYLVKEQGDSAIHFLKLNLSFIQNKFESQNELLAVCNDLMGEYYMSIFDADAAMKYYHRSLTIRKNLYHEDHPRIAFSYSNYAKYYSFKIERDSALFYAEWAYKLYLKKPEVSNHITYERIYMEYAYAYKIVHMHKGINKTKTLQETRKLYSNALGFIEKKYGRHSLASAAVYRNLGNTYTDILLGFEGDLDIKSNYFKKGIIFYDKSIAICSNYVIGNSSTLSTLYYVKGLLYGYSYLSDSSEKCIQMYDKAIESLIPSYLLNNTFSELELKTCSSKYELMTTIYTKSSTYLSLYLRTRNIEYLKSGYHLAKNLIPLWNYVIEEFESPYANRLITIYNGKIFNFLVQMSMLLYEKENNIQYLNDIFYFSEQSKCSLQNRLLEISSPFIPSNHSHDITPIDIQRALPNDNTLFLEFFDSTIVMGISKNNFIVKNINGNINQDSLLIKYQKILQRNNPEEYQSTTYQVYRTFFEPIIKSIGANIKYLIIASDGMISQVAVSGLVTDTLGNRYDYRELNYVVNQFSVRHVLSGNDFLKSKKHIYETPGTIIGFAPTFKCNSNLPFSKILIQNLKEKIQGVYYLEESATKEKFQFLAPNFRVVQLSTHAEADISEMMKSKIHFSDTSGQGAYISLDSIYKIKFQTQLAVLSACETNIGRMEYGEGSLNFARAFLYAGCESTLTTQWKVDDKTTSGILLAFYNNLMDGYRLSESLQEAQLSYLKNCKSSAEAHPFFWSSLVITGSDMTVSLDKKNNYLIYGITISTLIFFPIWFWTKRYRCKNEINS